MNVSKVTGGTFTIFLGFLIPVLNNSLWAIATNIQNAGRMMGDNNVVREYILPKNDVINFIYQMPWIMWIYFITMIGIGIYLLITGWKEKAK